MKLSLFIKIYIWLINLLKKYNNLLTNKLINQVAEIYKIYINNLMNYQLKKFI